MNNQMTQERREAYSEVLEIIKNMDKKYEEKIPLKLRQFFTENASKEYEFYINPSIPLEKYKLKEITLNILAMLNLNYWCEDEAHKQELIKQYSENERRYQEELKEKYNPENIFKKHNQVQNSEENIIENQTDIIEYKESIITKIINKIKSFLEKIKNI